MSAEDIEFTFYIVVIVALSGTAFGLFIVSKVFKPRPGRQKSGSEYARIRDVWDIQSDVTTAVDALGGEIRALNARIADLDKRLERVEKALHLD